MGKFVKVTVYVPIELKEYLNNRKISISRWCREAIIKKKHKFERMNYRYNSEPEYHERRLKLKKESRNRAKLSGKQVDFYNPIKRKEYYLRTGK